jgi:nucleoside-diphosphate-sugar epimerase
MKKILLFGSTGVIGTRLATFLDEKETIKFKFNRWDDLNVLSRSMGQFLQENCDDNSTIIWVAGNSNPRSSTKQIETNTKVFEIFIKSILDLSISLDFVKIIYLSSTGSIYKFDNKEIYFEDSPTNPTSKYGFQKISQELLLSKLSTIKSINCIVLRSPAIFGSSDFRSTGILNQIKYNRNFTLTTRLSTARQYVHINDLCDSIMKSINFTNFDKLLTKNLAPPDVYSMESLILHHGDKELIKRILSQRERFEELDDETVIIGTRYALELDPMRYIPPVN